MLARRLLGSLAALVACSASHRAVVTTTADFQEVEPAAQPRPAGSVTPPDPAAATPDPATGSAATPGELANSNGPVVFGLLDGEAALEDAWDRWNAGKTATYDQVFEIAVLANRARPMEMSDELMVIALARAVEMSNCDPERLGRIRLLAIAVNGSPHTRELDSELERLADIGPTECAAALK